LRYIFYRCFSEPVIRLIQVLHSIRIFKTADTRVTCPYLTRIIINVMNGRVSKKQAVFKIRAERICITVTYLTYVTKFVMHLTHDAYKMRFITFTNSLVVVTWFMYTEVRNLPTRLQYIKLRCTSYGNDGRYNYAIILLFFVRITKGSFTTLKI